MLETKILIADTHILIREGIKALLADKKYINIVGEVINSKELFNEVFKTKPDIVIIDFDIVNHFSINDIIFLRKKHPHINVLIISSNIDKKDILKVINLGVTGYLLKESEEEEILKAINALTKKQNFYSKKINDIIDEKPLISSNVIPDNSNLCKVLLSDREVEIIGYIVVGKTTKSIANKLFLSFHTVNTHRKNIFKKLKIHNSSELINFAIQKGIVNT